MDGIDFVLAQSARARAGTNARTRQIFAAMSGGLFAGSSSSFFDGPPPTSKGNEGGGRNALFDVDLPATKKDKSPCEEQALKQQRTESENEEQASREAGCGPGGQQRHRMPQLGPEPCLSLTLAPHDIASTGEPRVPPAPHRGRTVIASTPAPCRSSAKRLSDDGAGWGPCAVV